MKKYLLIILLSCFSLLLSACNLATNEVNDEPTDDKLIIGAVFDLGIDDERFTNLENTEYFKIYISNYSESDVSSFIAFSNKGILNSKINSKEEVIDDKKFIINNVYGEIVINNPKNIYYKYIFMDQYGNFSYGTSASGTYVKDGTEITISMNDEKMFRGYNIKNNFNFNFKIEKQTSQLKEVLINEFNEKDELINEYIVSTNKDHFYKINEECEYLIISDKYTNDLSEEIYKRKLINSKEIVSKFYYRLNFFNEYGFIEGNNIIISR